MKTELYAGNYEYKGVLGFKPVKFILKVQSAGKIVNNDFSLKDYTFCMLIKHDDIVYHLSRNTSISIS